MGKDRIFPQEISDYTNINATQIRRDLSASGSSASEASATTSTRCSGRSARSFARRASTTSPCRRGAAGQAIASSTIFAEHGINIAAILDDGPRQGRAADRQDGREHYAHPREARAREEDHRRRSRGAGADGAQRAADDLIGAGVRIILNYPRRSSTSRPTWWSTQTLAVELLYALYFHLTPPAAASARAEPPSGAGLARGVR